MTPIYLDLTYYTDNIDWWYTIGIGNVVHKRVGPFDTEPLAMKHYLLYMSMVYPVKHVFSGTGPYPDSI